MRAGLEYLSDQTIVVIDGIALLVIVVSTVEVCVAAGPIAVIRTALNFFLGRDAGEVRTHDQERGAVHERFDRA